MLASLMLFSLFDLFVYLEYRFSTGVVNLLSLWSSIWMEWLCLQTLLTYTLFKLYNSNNYLRQVITVMCVVILICLYLSLWQFELFACFLFLGEFTILIFVYCLYLHLKASVSRTDLGESIGNTSLIIGASLATLMIGSIISNWVVFKEDSSLHLFIDITRKADDFALNDLIALYYFFVNANITIHFIIGVMLFFLTIFLFTTVTVYTNLYITSAMAYRSVNMKLVTSKGYYEQSARFSQKYFTQNKKDN